MTARPSRAAPAARSRGGADLEPPPAGRLADRSPWQQHLLAVLLLWVAFAAVFPEIALQEKVFVSPDYDSPSYFGAAGRAAMRAGEYPLWNPYLFLGMPSFASLAFTPYVYPPSEILAALGKLPLAPPLLWLVVYHLAAGYGVFLLLRYLRCGFWPALLGGAAFMLQPHVVSMGVFGHGSKLACVAHLPYLLLLLLRLREPGGRRMLWTALLALAVGLLLLRGHPQIAFYGFLMLGVVGLVEWIAMARGGPGRGEAMRFAAGAAAGCGLGFALAAVMLLPVHAYARVSIRGAGETGGAAYQYATNWSFSPSELATLFLPSAAGFGEGTYVGTMPFTNFPNYVGVASLLFGVAALLLLRGRLVWVLLGVSVLAVLVSFGRNLSFAYDFFYRFLPYFNKFRVPVMILVLQQLAACVLLGLGAAALAGRLPRGLAWRRTSGRREASRAFAAAGAAAALLVLLALPWSGALAARVRDNPRLPPEARAPYAEVARRLLQSDGLRVGFFLAAQAAVVFFLWRRKLPADAAGALLVLLSVADLGAVDRRMAVPGRTWPGVAPRIAPRSASDPSPSPLVRFLQAQPRDGAAPLRILPHGAGFMNNEWMRWGIASAGGYHPAKLARFENLVDTRRQTIPRELFDLFAVRWLVLSEPLDGGPPPAYSGPDGVVYENPAAQPRAWVTGKWEPVAAAGCKARLLEPAFRRDRVVILESAPEPVPDSTAQGSARITAFGANRLTVEVQASAPGLLVVSEAWHPGWRARVDGAARPVLAADCVLRAVAVPAGSSRVELEFVDPALRRGLALTCAGLVVVLVLAVLGGRGRRGAEAVA